MALVRWRKRAILGTNAHGYSLRLKKDVVGLEQYFDAFISSHDIGFAKEQTEFWRLLHSRLDFDPATTLFVDDNCRVLDAALAFGIRGVIEFTCPDTRMAVKEPGTHRGVRRVASLI
jgi:putative hydrolase of the HAD superfamily